MNPLGLIQLPEKKTSGIHAGKNTSVPKLPCDIEGAKEPGDDVFSY